MASGAERPEIDALRELEDVLRSLEGELANWRRRALSAESRLTETGRASDGGSMPPSSVRELEEENQALGQRLQAARGRVNDLLERLRFLEQQRGNGGTDR